MSGLLVASLTGIAGLAGVLIVGVFTGLVIREAEGWLDMLPGWLLRLARRQIPVSLREELYDEWTAELHYALHRCDGRPLTRLWLGVRYAAGLIRACRRVASELGPVRSNSNDHGMSSGEPGHMGEGVLGLPALRIGHGASEVIALSVSPFSPGLARIDLEDVARDLSAGLTIREYGTGRHYVLEGARWRVVIAPRRGRDSGSPMAHVVEIRPTRQPFDTGKPVSSWRVAFHLVWEERACDLSGLTKADSPLGDEK